MSKPKARSPTRSFPGHGLVVDPAQRVRPGPHATNSKRAYKVTAAACKHVRRSIEQRQRTTRLSPYVAREPVARRWEDTQGWQADSGRPRRPQDARGAGDATHNISYAPTQQTSVQGRSAQRRGMLLAQRRAPESTLSRMHSREPVDYRIPHRPTFRIPRKHGKKRNSMITIAKGVLAAKMCENTEEFQVFWAVKGVSDNDEVRSSNLRAPTV